MCTLNSGKLRYKVLNFDMKNVWYLKTEPERGFSLYEEKQCCFFPTITLRNKWPKTNMSKGENKDRERCSICSPDRACAVSTSRAPSLCAVTSPACDGWHSTSREDHGDGSQGTHSPQAKLVHYSIHLLSPLPPSHLPIFATSQILNVTLSVGIFLLTLRRITSIPFFSRIFLIYLPRQGLSALSWWVNWGGYRRALYLCSRKRLRRTPALYVCELEGNWQKKLHVVALSVLNPLFKWQNTQLPLDYHLVRQP